MQVYAIVSFWIMVSITQLSMPLLFWFQTLHSVALSLGGFTWLPVWTQRSPMKFLITQVLLLVRQSVFPSFLFFKFFFSFLFLTVVKKNKHISKIDHLHHFYVHCSVGLSAFTQLCSHHQLPSTELFYLSAGSSKSCAWLWNTAPLAQSRNSSRRC